MEFATLVNRVRNEFLEMPGLQLTVPQAARLWGLETSSCRHVIDALVDTAFLRWTPRGTVVRTDAGRATVLPFVGRERRESFAETYL